MKVYELEAKMQANEKIDSLLGQKFYIFGFNSGVTYATTALAQIRNNSPTYIQPIIDSLIEELNKKESKS